MGVTYYVPGAGLQDTADAAAVDTTGAAPTTEQEAAAVSDVAVVGEYTVDGPSSKFIVLSVQNNLAETVDITASAVGYGADGSVVGTVYDLTSYAVGPGCVSYIYMNIDTEGLDVASYTTEISYSSSRHQSVIQNLSYAVTQDSKGVDIQLTNVGTVTAEDVSGCLLTFKDGALIGINPVWFDDVEPGETMTKDVRIYHDFDSTLFFVRGMAD